MLPGLHQWCPLESVRSLLGLQDYEGPGHAGLGPTSSLSLKVVAGCALLQQTSTGTQPAPLQAPLLASLLVSGAGQEHAG